MAILHNALCWLSVWSLVLSTVLSQTCSIPTNVLTSDCDSRCADLGACVVYQVDDDKNACEQNAAKEGTKSKDIDCLPADETSGCQYQCLNPYSDVLLPVFGYAFIVTFDEPIRTVLNVNSTLNEKYLDEIDLDIPKNIDRWILCGNRCADYKLQETAEVKISDDLLANAANLEDLTFINIDFSDEMPSFATLSSTVSNLSLYNCLLKDIPSGLMNATQLKYLQLDGNQITKLPEEFSLENLEKLSLPENNIESFEAILPSLNTLNLRNNSLDFVPIQLADYKSLSKLYLNGNPLSHRTVSPEVMKVLNNSLQDQTREWRHDVLFCSVGSVQTVKSTTLKLCVVDGYSGEEVDNQVESGASDSQASSTTSSEDSGTDMTSVYIAVPICICFLLAFIAFLLYRNRRRQWESEKDNGNTYTSGGTPTKSNDPIGRNSAAEEGTQSSIWYDTQLRDHQLDVHEIQDIKRLGAGGFGEVWMVQYYNRTYASKRVLRSKASTDTIQKFIEETKLVANLDHPNVVTFIGAAWTKRADFQAVFEFMENGDLRGYLVNPNVPPHWTMEKLQIAADIVEALVYVHSFNPPLVHRDLKSRNVLLSGDMEAKISDFGTARVVSEDDTMTAEGVGTSRWLAPEILRGDNDYNEASDLFSFGAILTELDTHELPYEDSITSSGKSRSMLWLASQVSAGSLQPSFSSDCPNSIRELGLKCLSYDPNDRPSAVYLQYHLKRLTQRLFLLDIAHLDIYFSTSFRLLFTMLQGSKRLITKEGFHAPEELHTLETIVAREQALDNLLDACSRFHLSPPERHNEVLECLLQARACSLDVITAVAHWRRRMVRPLPFEYKGVNYLLKLSSSDLDFVSKSKIAIAALDQVRLPRRNPFSTIGGLDQHLVHLLDKPRGIDGDLQDVGAQLVQLDIQRHPKGSEQQVYTMRLELAEKYLLLEEQKYGKVTSTQVAAIDDRMKQLAHREAEAASSRSVRI